MEINLERTNAGFEFKALKHAQRLDISASTSMAGENTTGFRPMELVLSALGSCMAIDVLNILYKQRQQVDAYSVKVFGHRAETVPAVFTHIDMDIYVEGDIQEAKLARAIKLSEDTYCSVHKMLIPTVAITTKYHLNHAK